MNVAARLTKIKSELPEGVTLIAVSKTKPNSLIEEAYSTGHLDFGENKVQELVDKYESLPENIRWHLIGHLQTNKVKYVAPFVHLIHAVDSQKLTKEIQKRAAQNDRVINVLVQIRIAKEETKFGLPYIEGEALLNDLRTNKYPNVNVIGLMGMATNTDNESKIREEFSGLKTFFDKQKNLNPNLTTLSMGMSGDYKIAIASGSTMVRVGSAIFGERKTIDESGKN